MGKVTMHLVKEKQAKARLPSELDRIRAELALKIVTHMKGNGVEASAVPGLSLYRQTSPTACNSAAYEPRLIVFVQGQKRIDLGKTTYLCSECSLLLTSVDLPVISQVIKASEAEPLLGLLIGLDMTLVREILSREEADFSVDISNARGMVMGLASSEILSACSRLLDLLDEPADIPFLGNLVQREILYRVLCSSLGKHLRAIATVGDQNNRIARAVAWLRANYAKPLRVEELAEIARMGVSTLHHHFRSLTTMSPIQYQKQLRLHAARQRLLIDGLDATSAAFEVGYESASQFSREYSRFFGQPPMRDAKSHRNGAVAARD